MNDISSNNDGESEWSPDELIPFGKYILLDRINSGATAAVYRANVRGEAGFERLVAIKRILPHMAGDRDFVDTFVREAKTVARLTHAGICPIYELGKVGESLYMAIEYIQGRDLGHITRRLSKRGQTMPPVIAAWIAARLCDSLDYAHNLKSASGGKVGIFHRDLSPSNILVSYEGQVKLIDFGLAKAVGRAQSTNVDALKRKLGYMSPEMVKGKPIDGRSDIFGVGVCLYEMITARRLFGASNDIDTLKLVGRALVPPPSAIIDDAPEELEIIVMHALEREPEDRFQSAAEMCETLNAYLHKAEPTFNSQKLAAWMDELFAEDIEAEQQRITRLLAASADPELIKQRKIFFASPSGAAARARAEIERRMSTEPPPVSHVMPTAVPRAAALPKEMASPVKKPPRAPREAPPPPAAQAASTESSTAALRSLFDEEPTGFYDPDKTKTAAVDVPAAFEEEPTGFYDAEQRGQAGKADAGTDAGQPRLADTQRLKPIQPQRITAVEGGTAPALSAPPAAGLAFEDEPTQFILDREVEDITGSPAAALQGVRTANPFDFDEEPTEIFFNKEEGIGIPELLEEINDVERPGGGLNKPIVAPELSQPPLPPAAPVPSRIPAARRPGPTAPPVMLPPPAAWPPPAARRREHSTLDTDLPGRGLRWPVLIAAIALLLLGIGALLATTPIGVALGLRAPAAGAIEVRTTPPLPAAVQLDQVYRGRAPLRMDGVRIGPRRLDIQADGYLPVTREVDVRMGTTSLVDIALVPDRPKAESSPGVSPGATAGPVPGVVND